MIHGLSLFLSIRCINIIAKPDIDLQGYPDQEVYRAAHAHPSILYEFGHKAATLLEDIGIEPPDEKDERALEDVLQRRFGLSPQNI
jgi:hypothetical protein